MSYLGVEPGSRSVRTSTVHTASAGQNTFNVTGGYMKGFVDVFVNGTKTLNFTATDSQSIVLSSNASLNDKVEIIAYAPLAIYSMVNKSGDSMGGDLTLPNLIATANVGGANGYFNNLRVNQNTYINNSLTVIGNTNQTGSLNLTGNLNLSGSLIITGEATSVTTSSLAVEDSIITMAANNTAADTLDIGFAGKYNNGSANVWTGLIRNATDKEYYFFHEYDTTPGNDVDTTDLSFQIANVHANFSGNVQSNNITVVQLNATNLNMTSSITLTGDASGYKQNSTTVYGGDAGAGFGRIEYYANKWVFNAGSDSANIAFFQRGNLLKSWIDDDGNFSATANNANNLGGVAAASYLQTSGSYTVSGTRTHTANLEVRSTNLIINSSASIIANGTIGTAGQVLTSNGSTIYWSFSGVNTAAQYTWTNTHTFQNTVTFGNSTVNSTVNSTILVVPSITGNLTGNVTATTISGNLTGNVAATTITGNLTGNVAATTITGNLTGNVAAVTITGNLTGNVIATTITGNLTGNVAATTITGNLTGNVAAVTITGNLTGNVIATTLSGNLTGNVVATTVNTTTMNVSSNLVVGSNVSLNTSILAIGNSTANVYVNSTSFVGNVAATTITGNLTGNVAATTITGNLTGNVIATTVSGNLTGNVVATTISGNLTGNVSATTVAASANVTVGANVLINTSAIVVSNSTAVAVHNAGTILVGNSTITTNPQVIVQNTSGALTVNTKIISTTGDELVLTQTGDTYGTTTLRLRNRNDFNGAVFEQGNTSIPLVDFIFAANPTTSRNIRFEARGGQTHLETPEFQIGTAANPTVTIGDSGVLFRKGNANFGSTSVTMNGAALVFTGNSTTLPTVTIANTGVFTVGNTSITGAPRLVLANTSGTTTINTNFISTTSISGNLTGNVAATTITGNLTGNVAAVTITGNLTGNVAATTITGNLTGNVSSTTTSASANVTVGANVVIDTAKASFGTAATTNAPQVIVANTSGTTTVNAGIVSTTTLNATTVNANTSGATVSATANVSSNTIFATNAFAVSTAFTANSTVVNAVSYNVGTRIVANTTVVNATHLEGAPASSYVNTSANYTIAGNLTFSGNSIFTGSNTTVNAVFRVVNSTDNVFFVAANGNIGIANTTPADELSVNGTTYLGDQVTFRGFTGGTVGSAVSGYNKTIVIGGAYNQTFNTGNSVLMHIADYDNDVGANVYPIYIEDENNIVDFFLYAGNTGSIGSKITYVGGNLGVGNTAPTNKLSVNGTTYLSGTLAVNGIATFNANTVITKSLSANGTTGASAGQFLRTGLTTNTYWGSLLSADVTTALGYTPGVGDITGVTASTGLTGGGTTGAVSLAVDGAAVLFLNNPGPLTAGLRINGSGLGVNVAVPAAGAITASGDITAFSSDARFKKDIEPIRDALEKLKKITGITYNHNALAKSLGLETGTRMAGVLAQEVEAVLPEVVTLAPLDTDYDEEGNKYSISGENYKTVKYDKMIPLLIEAIKELSEQVEELKKRLGE